MLPGLETVKEIHAAQRAFEMSRRTADLSFRKQSLRKLRQWISDNEKRISDALWTDLGKSSTESYLTEIGLVLEELRLHIRHLRSWAGPRYVLPALASLPATAATVAEPYGKVLIIAPWNYPFLLSVKPLVGAVSAGNTVIVKPSEMAPAVGQLIAEMAEELFDREHVAVVLGDKEAAEELLKMSFDHIFYTGNPQVGRIVMKAAAEHLTPVTLELGGKSPVIVDESADLDIAARRIVWGKFTNAGQTCIAPDHLYIHRKVMDEFLEKAEKIIEAVFGEHEQAHPYPRIINERHFDRLQGYLKGQELIRGGRTDRASLYFEPVFLRSPDPDSPVMQEEIFGPLLPVIPFDDISSVIRDINTRPKALAIYLFSRRASHRRRFIKETSSGALGINETLTQIANHRLPFGGVGQSGMGAYRGKYSFDTFSHTRSVVRNYSFPDIPIRYAPYSRLKDRLIRLFLG